MNVSRHLLFLSDIGRDKTVLQNMESSCPFCDRGKLTDILDEDGSMVLVKNKYPTLADTFQAVLIETGDCSADISTYDNSQMRRILTFGIDHWLRMEESGEFASVLFYKNHGPLSGGTVTHAHMQIVGLKKIDYRVNLRDEIFEGLEINEAGNGSLNISTAPKASFTEFNIITFPRDDAFMADSIKNVIDYLLNHWKCGSFNLFFYQWNGSIICKIIPRYVTSPFLIGYSIPQTASSVAAIAGELRKKYYG